MEIFPLLVRFSDEDHLLRSPTGQRLTLPMANASAIHSTGNSLITYLGDTYQTEQAEGNGPSLPNCAFELLSSGALANQAGEEHTRIGLYLYRITVSQHQRPHSPSRLAEAELLPLGVDLHYLLTAWGATSREEQIPLAWAIQKFHITPILDPSILSPEAAWEPDEILQITPVELAVDELMRIWDALNQTYRPSVAYVVRGVRLGGDVGNGVRPVVARRFSHGTAPGEAG